MKRDLVPRHSGWFLAIAAVELALAATTAFGQGPWAVYVMDADGSDVKKVNRDERSLFGSPVWLHDGKRIAYDGGRQGFDASHIFVHTLGEEKPQDIGPGNTPSFSPDDQQIAFLMVQNNTSGARPGIWVMNADGKSREWICEGARPRWSPDGEKLVFSSGHEGFPSLYVYDTVSLEQVRVLDRGYDQVIGAAFSPDSNQLVFIGYKGGPVRASSTDSEGEVAVVDARAGANPSVVCRSTPIGRLAAGSSCSAFTKTGCNSFKSSIWTPTASLFQCPGNSATATATGYGRPTANRLCS